MGNESFTSSMGAGKKIKRNTRSCLVRLKLELVRLGLIWEQEEGMKLFLRTLSAKEMSCENLQNPSSKHERYVQKVQAHLLRAR